MRKICFIIKFVCLTFALSAQVNFTSSNLPIILINTMEEEIQDEPKIMANMKVIDNEEERNRITDEPNDYDGWIGIEFRGDSSQDLYDKKSYGIETRKENGDNKNVSLLGMPKENDWVLHGPYGDKSLMRNALAYQFAHSIMPYAPRTHFCEMVLNGEYMGIYLLVEKIKRDKDRVDINELEIDAIIGDALTGGYIIKIDRSNGDDNEGWTSNYPPLPGASQTTFFQYQVPKADDIVSEQKTYIQTFMADFEEVMSSDEFADSLKGYSQYIDRASFIDYMLINEMCKNVDAYRLSTFLYKDRNSIDPLLKAGPVWDFNLGFGNVDFCAGPDPTGWVLDYNSICPEDNWIIHFWWNKLLSDPIYADAVRERWEALRQNEFKTERLLDRINTMAEELEEGQQRNFQQWNILGEYVWPNAIVANTYAEEISNLKNWLERRLIWMDENVADLFDPPYRRIDYFEPEVFPNPFDDQVTFKYYINKNVRATVRIFNTQGQRMAQIEKTAEFNGEDTIIWKPENVSGMFYYHVWFENEIKKSGRILHYKN